MFATLLPPNDLFGRLQLFCLYILPCDQFRVTICTIALFMVNFSHLHYNASNVDARRFRAKTTR